MVNHHGISELIERVFILGKYKAESNKIRQDMKQKNYNVRKVANRSWFGESFHY
jgi:hypothetical protein